MLRLVWQSVRSSIDTARTTVLNSGTTTIKNLRDVQARTIAVSSVANLKQIEQVTEGNVTKIEGKIFESERAPYVLNKDKTNEGCTLCHIQPHLKYTDVLILSQFLRPDGCVLPRRVTGVCWVQQRRLEVLINKAQRAGLLPQFRPKLASGKPRTNHRSNYKWKRYNVHFKE